VTSPQRPRSWIAYAALLILVAVSLVVLNFSFQRWRGHVYDQRTNIQAVLDSQVEAWNTGDLEGFMAGYWDSPELTFFSGKDSKTGWQATLERYRNRYQAEGKEMGSLTFSDIRIEQIDASHAWVRGRFTLVLSKETVGGLFTLIFKRLPEGWQIIHDHTSG